MWWWLSTQSRSLSPLTVLHLAWLPACALYTTAVEVQGVLQAHGLYQAVQQYCPSPPGIATSDRSLCHIHPPPPGAPLTT